MDDANADVDIEEALRRARSTLHRAYFNKSKTGDKLSTEIRELFTSLARGYIELAGVLQTERDWEERKIQEIKKISTGGDHAEVHEDDPD